MDWQIYIDPVVNCVFWRQTGPYTLEDGYNSMTKIIGHPEFQSGMNIFRDLRGYGFPSDLEIGTILKASKRIREEHDRQLGICKWAAVVSDGNSYAKMHQYITAGRLKDSQVDRNVFREIDRAKEWVGLPSSYEINYPTSE